MDISRSSSTSKHFPPTTRYHDNADAHFRHALLPFNLKHIMYNPSPHPNHWAVTKLRMRCFWKTRTSCHALRLSQCETVNSFMAAAPSSSSSSKIAVHKGSGSFATEKILPAHQPQRHVWNRAALLPMLGPASLAVKR